MTTTLGAAFTETLSRQSKAMSRSIAWERMRKGVLSGKTEECHVTLRHWALLLFPLLLLALFRRLILPFAGVFELTVEFRRPGVFEMVESDL